MKAVLYIRCKNCQTEVSQKCNTSIIAPGAFDFEIDSCRCGGYIFEARFIESVTAKPVTLWFDIHNYTHGNS